MSFSEQKPADTQTTPTMPTTPAQHLHLSFSLMLLMALATGLAVASNYYVQPLLHSLMQQFGLSSASAAWLVTTAQFGYALGLLLLVPLGDLFDRRRLVIGMNLLTVAGLLLIAFSPSTLWLFIGAAVTGLCSIGAQILVPFAASLASETQRGRVIGILMSGLLLGILLARTVAGLLAGFGDWRLVYVVAAIALLSVSLILALRLPREARKPSVRYRSLLRSVYQLFQQEPQLRLRAFFGAMAFACFSVLWTALAFLLSSPPYGYGEAVIGLFGLLGVAGVMAANWAGRMSDTGHSTRATSIFLAVLCASWLPLGFAQHSLFALIIGILLLDLAVQGVHISNQGLIYAIRPESRSRMTSAYMTSYFSGGAIGSLSCGWVYQHSGWLGVVGLGAGFALLAMLVWLAVLRLQRPQAKS